MDSTCDLVFSDLSSNENRPLTTFQTPAPLTSSRHQMEAGMQIGDHLVSTRLGYTHHGLYLGDDQVIHYSGLADGLSSGTVEITTLELFSGDGGVSTKSHLLAVHNIEQRIARAMSRLGEDQYNLVTNNCEHFVSWCIDGSSSSRQVSRTMTALASPLTSVSPITGSTLAALVAATQAAQSSEKPVQAAAVSLTKNVASSAATVAIAAVVAPAAIPVAIVAGVGAAAVYGIKKLFSIFD